MKKGFCTPQSHWKTSYRPKVVQDFAGHYNQFDLLSLSLRRQVPHAIEIAGKHSDPSVQVSAPPSKAGTLREIRLDAALNQTDAGG